MACSDGLAGFDMNPRGSGKSAGSRLREGAHSGVPILLYHRVSDHPIPGLEHYCVSPASFRRQMEWLEARGYESVSLDALVEHYMVGAPMRARPVIITFDDGYRDNLDNAYPVLESLNLKAVMFLVAGAIGREAAWDAAFGPAPSLLSWSEIHSMSRGPMTFGAHTVNHPHLCKLAPRDAWQEIRRARELIEDGLGQEVSSFAYPFSDFNNQLRDYVAGAGYKVACSSMWGLSSPADDVYALRRLIVGGEDSLDTFAQKVAGTSGARAKSIVRPVLRKLKRFLSRDQKTLAGGV